MAAAQQSALNATKLPCAPSGKTSPVFLPTCRNSCVPQGLGKVSSRWHHWFHHNVPQCDWFHWYFLVTRLQSLNPWSQASCRSHSFLRRNSFGALSLEAQKCIWTPPLDTVLVRVVCSVCGPYSGTIKRDLYAYILRRCSQEAQPQDINPADRLGSSADKSALKSPQ
eukprot:3871735-Amphidinium_carterae.1